MSCVDGDTPCDFLIYLEWRLGQDGNATTKMLGEWLSTYKPVRHAPGYARELSPSPGAEPGASK